MTSNYVSVLLRDKGNFLTNVFYVYCYTGVDNVKEILGDVPNISRENVAILGFIRMPSGSSLEWYFVIQTWSEIIA